jgi:hypothetical protein
MRRRPGPPRVRPTVPGVADHSPGATRHGHLAPGQGWTVRKPRCGGPSVPRWATDGSSQSSCRSVETDQPHCVPAVGFHADRRAAPAQRRRDHLAGEPQLITWRWATYPQGPASYQACASPWVRERPHEPLEDLDLAVDPVDRRRRRARDESGRSDGLLVHVQGNVCDMLFDSGLRIAQFSSLLGSVVNPRCATQVTCGPA